VVLQLPPPMAARVDKLLPGNQQVAMGQLATPMKSLKISDDDVAVMATWDASQTAGWLEQIGLGIFAQQFTEHQITGDLLPLLSKEELKDMGIGLVGPRTQLLKHIFKLKLRYQNVQRNRVVWEALEKQHCLEGCFEPPDKYTLTNSSLKMTEKVYPFGKLCGICCGCKGTKINTIDMAASRMSMPPPHKRAAAADTTRFTLTRRVWRRDARSCDCSSAWRPPRSR